jgi:prepilin-type N-terminal cleavage/methylation domain-containing protein
MTQRLRGLRERGFTLTELAVVFVIVSLLLGTAMYTLSAQMDQRNFEETRRRLEAARELLLAFAIVNGRLPCPATAGSSGDEAPTGGGTCASPGPYGGFLPARTIGFQVNDAGGYAVDAWNNRIRYAVSAAVPVNSGSPRICRPVNSFTPPVAPHFTHRDNMRFQGLDCQPSDLIVCRSATGITSSNCGGAANQVMTQDLVAAIIFSGGENYATAPDAASAITAGRTDEAANLDGDRVFVWHTPTPAGPVNGEFDDHMLWIPVGELYAKLIAAGVLP